MLKTHNNCILLSSVPLLSIAFLLIFAPSSHTRTDFGSVEGTLGSISADGSIIEIIALGGDKPSRLFLSNDTLIWQNEQVIELFEEHIGRALEVEFYVDQDGRYVCEWVELTDGDIGERSKRKAGRANQPKSKEVLRETRRGPKNEMGSINFDEDDAMLKDKINKKSKDDSSQFSMDLSGSIDSEGRDLINMSPEEYNQSVEKEAQKILEALGIE